MQCEKKLKRVNILKYLSKSIKSVFNTNNKSSQLTKKQMKVKKQTSINISLANYMNSNTNRLLLHTRSTNYLANSTKSNRSFEQSSKSKSKCHNGDIKQQNMKSDTIINQSSVSQCKHNTYNKQNYPRQSSLSKLHQQSHRNLISKPNNYTLRQNSGKKQEGGSKNRQQIKSYRKIQLSQRQNKDQKKEFRNIEKIQRPHQSQNLRSLEQGKNYQSHKKLYTFCGQNKSNKENSQQKYIYRQGKMQKEKKQEINYKNNSQQSINSSANYSSSLNMNNFSISNTNMMNNVDYGSIKSTIIVKEEELKRFTHKFARQKIQFEQTIQILQEKVDQLKVINQNLSIEKSDMYECLKYKEEEVMGLQQKMQELKGHIKAINSIHEQYVKQLHRSLQQKIILINNLEEELIAKEQRIQQMELFIQTKQREYHAQIQKMKDRQDHKLFFPLTNVNHAESINTEISNESNNRFSIQIFEQLELIKLENVRLQHKQSQYQKSLAFLNIQNEHLVKQLDLEKKTTFCLREQILQLKFKIQAQNKLKFQKNQPVHEQSQKLVKSVQPHIDELLALNAQLTHNKQTLQRSLQVSSEMILCLKQQNTQIKIKYDQMRQLGGFQQQKILVSQVKKIVLLLMKDQLQLQDQINLYVQKPNLILRDQKYEKKYAESYQSRMRNSEKNDGQKSKLLQDQNDRNFTEGSLIEQVENFVH